METTASPSPTASTSGKYLSPTWLIGYAIIGNILGMITALGPARPVFRIAGFVIAVVALIQLIRTRKQKNIVGWILLIIYAILWWFTANVALG